VTVTDLQALERDYVMPTYARQPVEFVRGEGTRLWDAEGNEYLDFLAGVAVVQIGHCHPALVDAVRDQAERLMHASNLYYTEPAMRLAKRLSERSLGGKVFFTNSGAEANECAIKLARKRRRGGDVVVLEGTGARTARCPGRRRRPSRSRSRRWCRGSRWCRPTPHPLGRPSTNELQQ
jgi:acetylornithine/N-succinyldiaminopimelate aminotransferase